MTMTASGINNHVPPGPSSTSPSSICHMSWWGRGFSTGGLASVASAFTFFFFSFSFFFFSFLLCFFSLAFFFLALLFLAFLFFFFDFSSLEEDDEEDDEEDEEDEELLRRFIFMVLTSKREKNVRNPNCTLNSFEWIVPNQPWVLRDAFLEDLLRLLLLEEEDDDVVDDDEEDRLRFFSFSCFFSRPPLSCDRLRSIVVALELKCTLGQKLAQITMPLQHINNRCFGFTLAEVCTSMISLRQR